MTLIGVQAFVNGCESGVSKKVTQRRLRKQKRPIIADRAPERILLFGFPRTLGILRPEIAPIMTALPVHRDPGPEAEVTVDDDYPSTDA
jgi:hypothetical protein